MDDKMHGTGKLLKIEGGEYEGGFYNNQFQGEGVEVRRPVK